MMCYISSWIDINTYKQNSDILFFFGKTGILSVILASAHSLEEALV